MVYSIHAYTYKKYIYITPDLQSPALNPKPQTPSPNLSIPSTRCAFISAPRKPQHKQEPET